MKKILWITNTEKRKEYLLRGLLSLKEALSLETSVEVRLISAEEIEALTEEDFKDYGIVLVSFMSAQEGSDKLYHTIFDCENLPYVFLSSPSYDLPSFRLVEPSLVEWMEKCILYSGLYNMEQLWRRVIATYGADKLVWADPIQTLGNGLYHPESAAPYDSYEAYAEKHCMPNQPNVGILFLRDDWLWGNTEVYDTLIREIEAQGMNAIPLFSYWVKNEEEHIEGVDAAVKRFFMDGANPRIDVLINNFKMSMLIGRPVEKDFLQALGVPILQAYHTRATCEAWGKSQAGLVAQEISATVSMVEYDGVIHGVPISGQEMKGGFAYRKPMVERITFLVQKAKKWAKLRNKANVDKKIAIIFHNYPANNAFVGCAADLDSGESVFRLLRELKKAGYETGALPENREALMKELLRGLTNDRRYEQSHLAKAWPHRLEEKQYASFFLGLPIKVQEEMRAVWGAAPGDVFVDAKEILISGKAYGNIFVSMQPPRGFGEDLSRVIHDPAAPPTHHYLAYYCWLREVWEADAVIHVGTHGSLEWLPGKQNGLSNQCYPEIALGDLPNLYPYLITIIGEGIQAKRRGAAVLFGYLPAPKEQTGLYKEWGELEVLTEEFSQFSLFQKNQVHLIWEQILEHLEELGATDLLNLAKNASQEDFFLALHNRLEDLRHSQIRTGLHILGEMPRENYLKEFLYELVETTQGEHEGLPYFLGRIHGVNYSELLKKKELSKEELQLLGCLKEEAREFLSALAQEEYLSTAEVEKLTYIPAESMVEAKQLAMYIMEKLVPAVRKGKQEIDNILVALEGQYIEPSPAGSPGSGNVEVLPTGRNFYGIDPSLIPTPAAWELGKQLGEEVIRRFIEEESKYPEQIGIVVWCGPNMRSRGQCIAEILYLLGVKPIWREGSYRVEGLEVIPLDELKRPRIDVVARISGLVRDAMPSVVTLVNEAIYLVVDLEESEEDNYVKKHALALQKELEGLGRSASQAIVESRYRVFGCPLGAYGAGVGGLLESKNWENDEDIAKTYLQWGGYAYDGKGDALPRPELFARQLSLVDIAIKNEDTKDVNMLSSDDFNAYHGGMIAAVRAKRGMAPKGYCGDTSDRQAVRVRTVEESFQRIFYGEVINPAFIEGMMKHGHKGALEMAKFAALSYGWDVTSGTMSDGMYAKVAEKYVLDDRVRQWMVEVNPWAAQRIVEVLLEANQRNLWKASDDMLEELRDKYLSLEGALEESGL